jgi:hypothetical protein
MKALPSLLLLCALLWPPRSEAASIVQNGSFHSSSNAPFGIPGWTYPGFVWVPAGGGYDGYVGVVQYMSQILNTQPDQTYRLEFSIKSAINGTYQAPPYGIAVSWGEEAPVLFNMPTYSFDWSTEQLTFTATSTQTLLKFTQPYSAFPYLDDVTVVPIPEPCACCLLAVGFLLAVKVSHASKRQQISAFPHKS